MSSGDWKKLHYPVGLLYNREIGNPFPLGYSDYVMKSCYTYMAPTSFETPESKKTGYVKPYGGVFNLEFSLDGSIMVAACEAKCILIYDALCQKQIKELKDAHTDCVNFIRFLDSRMFATCSDDTTVALWDIRNLKSKIRTLIGHSNWVKNIEYSQSKKMLITSGFDGSIYTWDINNYTEDGLVNQRIFHTNGLMRTRLVPSEDKLIICTTGGYLIIIHNLDLDNISSDLAGFKPNMYRLMQLSNTAIPLAINYSHLFHARRNRVELVSDFPDGNDAEVISSLQVHPQGWCVLSRNTSTDENSEWSCVHDIQDLPKSETEAMEVDSSAVKPEAECDVTPSQEDTEEASSDESNDGSLGVELGEALDISGFDLANIFNPDGFRVTSREVLEALQIIQEARLEEQSVNNSGSSSRTPSTGAEGDSRSENTLGIFHANLLSRNAYLVSNRGRARRTVLFLDSNRLARNKPTVPSPKIQRNSSRLIYHIQEPNMGRGFIKEQCFSADGRLLCSPYGCGVRLLGFNFGCSELPHCLPLKDKSEKLMELTMNQCHTNVVVSTKFSPSHCLLVSGCLDGKIAWHQPAYNIANFS